MIFKKYTVEHNAVANRTGLFPKNWFIAEEQERLNESMTDYYAAGYTFDNVAFSNLNYDVEKSMLYYDAFFDASNEKGSATMHVKLYNTIYGLLPPEKEDIDIKSDGKCDELVNALSEFFG